MLDLFNLPASFDEVICIKSAICCLSLIGVETLGRPEVDVRCRGGGGMFDSYISATQYEINKQFDAKCP